MRYRLELDGLNTREVRACSDDETANDVYVCSHGDGTINVGTDESGVDLILTGEFDPHGEYIIDLRGLFLGARAEGPYRQYQQEFLPLRDEAVSGLQFPALGVEVQPMLDIDPGNRRYDNYEPAPYRLYPDGWAFLVEHPGGPVDIRVTDIAGEARMNRMRDLFSLLTGIFVGLAAEGVTVLVFNRTAQVAAA